MLGVFLLAGTATAVLAVRPRAAYLIIPVPALAYVVAATIAGLIHDRADDTSHTALAIRAAQWIASGFLAMTAATLLAIAVTAARWPAADPARGAEHPRPLRRSAAQDEPEPGAREVHVGDHLQDHEGDWPEGAAQARDHADRQRPGHDRGG